ncbi:MAG TPA: alpha/beta hydrolase [Anaerolineales bacterium]|nr:alpha/beta hydrolase [Anaerolineales bacterium]
MSAIILRNEIVHYEVLGRGKPLIFLHGWVGSWRYWIPAMQSASVAFRTYALDLWGFGDTAKKPENYAIDRQLALLDEFIQELGIGKIALVGHGLGAVLAWLYASHNPSGVDRAVGISLPQNLDSINPRLRSASPPELADWLLGRSPNTEPVRAEAPKTDYIAIQTSLANLQEFDLDHLSLHLPIPCLWMHGQNDPAVQAPDPQRIASLPEQAHYISFEQSGHYPMLDETNKFNRLLNDMLILDSGVSPRQLQLKEEWKRRVR